MLLEPWNLATYSNKPLYIKALAILAGGKACKKAGT